MILINTATSHVIFMLADVNATADIALAAESVLEHVFSVFGGSFTVFVAALGLEMCIGTHRRAPAKPRGGTIPEMIKRGK